MSVIKAGKHRYFIRTPGIGDYQKLEISQRIYDGADCYPWTKTFVLWPRRSITGQYLWMTTAYKRRFWAVWGKSGFHMEPEVEYATILEILADNRPK